MIKTLKGLAQEAQNLSWAANRQIDLLERNGAGDSSIQEMVKIYGANVQSFMKDLNGMTLRITPEQVDADTAFQLALQKSLNEWKAELSIVQSQSVEQAILDGKAGVKSERYIELEKREQELKVNIAEAEQKLGQVSERVASPSFAGTVNQIVNSVKPI